VRGQGVEQLALGRYNLGTTWWALQPGDYRAEQGSEAFPLPPLPCCSSLICTPVVTATRFRRQP